MKCSLLLQAEEVLCSVPRCFFITLSYCVVTVCILLTTSLYNIIECGFNVFLLVAIINCSCCLYFICSSSQMFTDQVRTFVHSRTQIFGGSYIQHCQFGSCMELRVPQWYPSTSSPHQYVLGTGCSFPAHASVMCRFQSQAVN